MTGACTRSKEKFDRPSGKSKDVLIQWTKEAEIGVIVKE
jgi:hypothetical protein